MFATFEDPSAATHELRFASLFQEGRALSFPCDDQGHVNLDALSARARNNYLLARAAVGRDYAKPTVEAVVPAQDQSRVRWTTRSVWGVALSATF